MIKVKIDKNNKILNVTEHDYNFFNIHKVVADLENLLGKMTVKIYHEGKYYRLIRNVNKLLVAETYYKSNKIKKLREL